MRSLIVELMGFEWFGSEAGSDLSKARSIFIFFLVSTISCLKIKVDLLGIFKSSHFVPASSERDATSPAFQLPTPIGSNRLYL